MAIKLIDAVLDSDLPPNLRLVAVVLADYAAADGSQIFPSYDTIARRTGFSRRQAIRLVLDLEARRWLYRRGTVSGRKHTNRWQLVVPECRDAEKVTPMSPLAEKVTSKPEKVTNATRKGDTHVTQSVINRHLDPSGDFESRGTGGRGEVLQDEGRQAEYRAELDRTLALLKRR